MLDLRKHIYNLLQESREEAGLTRYALAELADLSQNTIIRLETEEDYSLGLRALEKLIVALEVNPVDLIPGEYLDNYETLEKIKINIKNLNDLAKKL